MPSSVLLEIPEIEQPTNIIAEAIDIDVEVEEVEVLPEEVIEVIIDDIEVVWLAEP